VRIKLLGRRRQWFLEKGEDWLSERSERGPQPQNHQLRMPLRKRPCAELFASFCRHKKKRTPINFQIING
ncbi:MAG: hypothetical protein IJW68_07985, partial [Bacteroidaceae bacterium]|nr:hypothetical protein [Bacteroidaceae bacterium]